MRETYVRNPVRLFSCEVKRHGKKISDSARELERLATRQPSEWQQRFRSGEKSFSRRSLESEIARWSKVDFVEPDVLKRKNIVALIDLMDIWVQHKRHEPEFSFLKTSCVSTLTHDLQRELEEETNNEYSALRGVWQIVRRSLRYEHRSSEMIRLGGMVVFGFDQREGRPPLQVLLIGPRGVLFGEGWVRKDMMYIDAHETRKEADLERQFIIFHIPDLSDRYEKDDLGTIRGIFSAGVFGAGYRRAQKKYPIVATECIATKMMGDASNWLAMRDYRLDDGFVEQFRQRFPCGYSDPAQARLRDDTPAIQSLDESSSWLKHVLVVE